ncbi:FkbM family methyltransferase [Luminiphilus sp.]|nr:FkbM family methyltransferase [Luminiphilus sp.]
MKNKFVIHDVGAANFIPRHLLHEDMAFYHFEPDPRGIMGLEEFYKSSEFSPVASFVRAHALGSKKSRMELNLNQKNTASSFKSVKAGSTQVTVQVEVAEELIASEIVEVPNLVKIDVEGFEGEVLAGYDLSRPEICCVEVEVTLDQLELGNIINLLTEAGFDLAKIVQHGSQHDVPPTKLQKRVQRTLAAWGWLLATDGNALNGMASLSSSLVQLELVFTRFNTELPFVARKIKDIYGLCYRDRSGRLYAGERRIGLLPSWRFWR